MLRRIRVELKAHTKTLNGNLSSGAGALYWHMFDGIAHGTDDNQRIGQTINISSIKVNAWLTIEDS